jgi:hypothetical protein
VGQNVEQLALLQAFNTKGVFGWTLTFGKVAVSCDFGKSSFVMR